MMCVRDPEWMPARGATCTPGANRQRERVRECVEVRQVIRSSICFSIVEQVKENVHNHERGAGCYINLLSLRSPHTHHMADVPLVTCGCLVLTTLM
jgi:hypothetical protein